MKEPVSIVVIDDHPLVREGIRHAIEDESDMVIVGEAASAEAGIALVRKLHPHIVLMDINMPGTNGLEATRTIVREVPGTKVIGLTSHNSRQYVVEIVQAGAVGYILKDTAPVSLLQGVREVMAGRSYFSAEVGMHLIHALRTQEPETLGSNGLTAREKELAKLVSEGKSNKEIATLWGISVRTVEKHRERLMEKLDVKGSAGITRYAVKEGLS